MLAPIFFILGPFSAGLRHYRSQFDPEVYPLLLKYHYIGEILYTIGITMPKYSALLFYVRVFGIKSISSFLRKNVLVAVGLVTLFPLFALPSAAIQCIPIRKAWAPFIPGHCIAFPPWSLIITIANVLLDFYIMILPIPTLWSLHVGRKRKMILIGLFFCAYS